MNSQHRYIWFDLIRGVSALAVYLSHLRSALLVDYKDILHPSFKTSAFYFITGLGHQSVMIFFVLSGFFVGGSILNKLKTFSWTSYLEARLTRLWVVLLPALLLTYFIDKVIMHYHPEALHGTYLTVWNSGPGANDSETRWDNSILTFVSNLFFLQTIVTPVFGTNSPLWSLANEFCYYIIFPALLSVFGLINMKKHNRVILVFLILLLLIMLPQKIILGGIIWVIGIAIWKCEKKYIEIFHTNNCKTFLIRKISQFIFLLSFVISLWISKKSLLANFPSDLIVALSFGLLAFSLINSQDKIILHSEKIVKFISNISYSLYLVHFPIVIAIASILYRGNQIQPNSYGILIFAAWAIVIFLISIAFWWAFEKRTTSIRRLISRN